MQVKVYSAHEKYGILNKTFILIPIFVKSTFNIYNDKAYYMIGENANFILNTTDSNGNTFMPEDIINGIKVIKNCKI